MTSRRWFLTFAAVAAALPATAQAATATPGGRVPAPSVQRTCPGDFPAPSCTGVPAGTRLTDVPGGMRATRAGQVIDGKLIRGRLTIAAPNVTIRNSEIWGEVSNMTESRGTFTITDSTVGAPTGCNGQPAVGERNFTATRVLVRNFGDGFRDSGSNILIQDSFARMCANPEDHSDGVQGYKGGSNVIVRHNTLDQRYAQRVTAPIFIADYSKGIVAERNLLAGGSYSLRLHDGDGFVAHGNRIVDRSWIFGPVASDCERIDWADNAIVQIDAQYRVTKTVRRLDCA